MKAGQIIPKYIRTNSTKNGGKDAVEYNENEAYDKYNLVSTKHEIQEI